MKEKIFLILITLMFFVSCTNVNYDKQIKSIDSLIQKIDTVSVAIKKIDNVDFLNKYNVIFAKIKIFGKAVRNTDLNTSKTMKLNEFANLSKFYKRISGQKEELNSELILSKQQLRNLKNDLSKNLIPKDSVNIYFNNEINNAKELFEESEILLEGIEKNNKKYNSLLPFVNNVCDSIINTNKN